MSDADYYVSNAVGYLLDDLYPDDRYAQLSDVERAAILVWVLDGRIRIDGLGGWVESDGPRTADALVALQTVGAVAYSALLVEAFALLPTKTAGDADERLSGMDSWTTEESRAWCNAEDAHFALLRQDDLIDNYLRPFVASHPEDFPISVEGL